MDSYVCSMIKSIVVLDLRVQQKPSEVERKIDGQSYWKKSGKINTGTIEWTK